MPNESLRKRYPTLAAAAVGLVGTSVALWAVRRALRRRAWALHTARHGEQQVVVLGAGFAGVNAARGLAEALRDAPHIGITLVDRNDYQLFTPMLTEAAGGEIEPQHIVSPLEDLPARINLVRGRVDAVDLDRKEITLRAGPGDDAPAHRLAADHLVLALGAVPNFHHVAGLREHAFTLKSLPDAHMLRARTADLLERADAEPDPAVRRRLLTVVVGGGGYTGVETMAAINDALREGAARTRHLRPADVRTVLVEPGDRLLPELTANLAAYAEEKLRQRGVDVRVETTIVGAGSGWVAFKGGERLETETLIWAGGVTPNPVVTRLPCARSSHGAVVVDRTCAVPGYAGVWAVGDCAAVPRAGSDETYAPTAQNAVREGTLVAKNVAAALRGVRLAAFDYRPLGEMALVGRHSGVARVYGVRLAGPLAWAMWRAVYLFKMPSARQRLRIAADWLLDALVGRTLVELPAPPARPALRP